MSDEQVRGYHCPACGHGIMYARDENGRFVPLDMGTPTWKITGAGITTEGFPTVARSVAFASHAATCASQKVVA